MSDWVTVSESALTLDAAVEFPSIRLEATNMDAVLSVTAPAAPVSRAPIRLVAVLDRSGSMGGPKLQLLKASMRCLLQHLTDADQLGVVVYDTNVHVMTPLVRCDREGKAALDERLRSIHAGSQTNLSGGLMRGLELHAPEEGVVRSTFLFTDGLANHGISEPGALCAAVEESLRLLDVRGAPTTLHTFGLGDNHNADLLRKLAEESGAYAFIETEDGIADAFGEALGGLLSMTHQNIQLKIQPTPGVQILPRTSYPTNTLEDGSVVVEFGDLLSEERRDVLATLTIPAADEPARCTLATISARAFDLARGTFVDVSGPPVQVVRGEQSAERNPDVSRHQNRRTGTDAMEAARGLGAAGRVQEAEQLLRSAQRAITESGMRDRLTTDVMQDLEECARDMSSEVAYRSAGQKKLAMCSAKHGKQRAVGHGDMYSNSMQMQMKANFRAFSG